MNWDITDFAVVGALLIGLGLGMWFIVAKIRSTAWRIVLAVALLALVVLMWIELAVGIFNTPFSGN